MTPLAVLRPEPGNAATAALVEAAGLPAIRLPLFVVRALDWTAPDPAGFDALLLTSANAVRFGGSGLDTLRHLPVLAVGTKTAEAARLAGFDVMASGTSDAAALLALAEARGVSRGLHLAGRDRTVEAGGTVAQVIPVYASEVQSIGRAALGRLAGSIALLHSARAARRLGALLAERDLPRSAIGTAAISAAVAAAAGTGWTMTTVATEPSDPALIAAAIEAMRARD